MVLGPDRERQAAPRLRFQDHFSGHAGSYARHRPLYPEEIYRWLASLAPAHDLAWDCGTGNGQVAIALTRFFARVVATDPSLDQLENAVKHQQIDYRLEQAERTSLDPDSVDLVTVGAAVHWFDFEGFYSEVTRVSKPGGALAVWAYGPPQIDRDIDRLVVRLQTDVLRGYWPERISHVEASYRTLPFPFDEIDPPAFVMTVSWDLPALIGFLGTWSGSQRYLAERGRHPLDEIIEDLEAAWGEPESERKVSWPLFFRVGRVK